MKEQVVELRAATLVEADDSFDQDRNFISSLQPERRPTGYGLLVTVALCE